MTHRGHVVVGEEKLSVGSRLVEDPLHVQEQRQPMTSLSLESQGYICGIQEMNQGELV